MGVQRRWQRVILLSVLGYEGLGALAGGGLLTARPDGRLMDIPVSVMRGAFSDFLIPGVILFGLGALNVAAFFAVLRRHRLAWLGAGLALGGMMTWFFVEIVILGQLHPLHAMWGFPVLLGAVVAVPLLPFGAAALRDTGLGCGVASSFLYVAMNLIVARQWVGYSSWSQTISELSAIGAPTRPLWVALGIVHTLLVTAFGWGVRVAAGDNRRLRAAGTLLAVHGALGVLWVFAPMHLRPVLAAGGGNAADTLHLTFAVVTELFFLSALALAAAALGAAFRIYSVATMVLLVALAVPVFQAAPRVAANLPTPLLGLWERLDVGVFLLWVLVLATVLLVRGRVSLTRGAVVARYRGSVRGGEVSHGT